MSVRIRHTYEDELDTKSHPNIDYWSLTACGITYGQTQHMNPEIELGVNGLSSLADAQNTLVSQVYHQIQSPWDDSRSVGFDYGKINSIGIGGCTGGEFRDENFIYTTGAHTINGVTTSTCIPSMVIYFHKLNLNP